MSSLNRTASMSNSFAQPYGARNQAGLAVPAISKEAQLVRMTLAHMLWEKQFYVDGKSSAETLGKLAGEVAPEFVANLARQARNDFKLRHVPLALMRTLAAKQTLKAQDLADVIQRPDEMGEFLAMYNSGKKQPLSNQVKKGLATAFSKFNEYSLAKWDKNSAAYSVRDVMFLTHPKPANDEQAALFKRVANKELVTPDTWETELSAGADKRMTFTRLMAEKKLGALAFLRNLRNMVESGVPENAILAYSLDVNVDKVLPFRYIAAARIMPQFQSMLENMMFRSLAKHEKLPGKTILLVDVSGSMFGIKVSAKSDLERYDAAASLAILCREICEEVEVYSFSNRTVKVRDVRGFALIEAIKTSQEISGTDLRQAVNSINTKGPYTRCIVFTDENSQTMPSAPKGRGYVVNVAAQENGINHSSWTSITGFSEAIIDYIQMFEKT